MASPVMPMGELFISSRQRKIENGNALGFWSLHYVQIDYVNNRMFIDSLVGLHFYHDLATFEEIEHHNIILGLASQGRLATRRWGK